MYILAASRIVATATSGPRTHSQGKRQLCRRWERASGESSEEPRRSRRGDAPRSNALTLLTELLDSILPAFPSALLRPPQSFVDQQDSRETLSQASGVLPRGRPDGQAHRFCGEKNNLVWSNRPREVPSVPRGTLGQALQFVILALAFYRFECPQTQVTAQGDRGLDEGS
jgi:hypothetical protein